MSATFPSIRHDDAMQLQPGQISADDPNIAAAVKEAAYRVEGRASHHIDWQILAALLVEIARLKAKCGEA